MRTKTVSMIGELVRDQRKQRGWSQTELAEKAGVSRLWIGHLEKGKETVELGKVLRTLQMLGISMEAGLLRGHPLAPKSLSISSSESARTAPRHSTEPANQFAPSVRT